MPGKHRAANGDDYWVEYRLPGNPNWLEQYGFETREDAEAWALEHLGDDVIDVHVHEPWDGE